MASSHSASNDKVSRVRHRQTLFNQLVSIRWHFASAILFRKSRGQVFRQQQRQQRRRRQQHQRHVRRRVFLIGPFLASFSLFSRLFDSFDTVEFLPMTGTEPRISSVGSDRCTNWVTTTTLEKSILMPPPSIVVPFGPSYSLFSVFSNKLHYNFTTNICENVHPVYGAGIWTFGTWVSSHNH